MLVRHQAIMKYLVTHKSVSVEELVRCFNVSEVTIRKDLSMLEQQGLLLRRYGGATLLENIPPSTGAKELNSAQKSIANACVAMIKDHQRIIIDSGNTTAALIPLLSDRTGLVVMTNSLSVANQLVELPKPPNLLMSGGTWDVASRAFQGKIAEQVLRAYDFELLFIGADGIDMEKGTTTFNELVDVSRVMAEVSKKVIVMLESQKIGRKIPNVELAWEMIDVVVTDRHISPTHLSALREKQIEVMIAE